MRILFWFVIVCAAAVGLAVLAQFNAGNVAVFYPPYRIDMSLNFFLIAIAVAFVCCYIVVRAIRLTRKLPARVIAYRRGKREADANKQFREAVKAYFEGRFGHAEKAATKSAVVENNAGLAALIGARSAHRMQQQDRRDAWLASTGTNPAMNAARMMIELEMAVEDRQHQRALELVAELHASGARHIQVLQLALRASQQAKDWREVLRLVKVLDKRHAINPTRAEHMIQIAYEGLISDASLGDDSLRAVWSSIPNAHKTKPFIAAAAARAFVARGLHDDARTVVERALKENWDARLIRSYRDAIPESSDSSVVAQIERCEQWLAKYPKDAELLLTLGVLCVKQKLWGQAQKNLEQALQATPDPRVQREGHLGLARMFEGLGQHEKAQVHFKRCAELTEVRHQVLVPA